MERRAVPGHDFGLDLDEADKRALIAFLRIFDYVYGLTGGQGGPLDATKPLVLKIYETAFGHFEMGYAAAQTVVLFVMLLAISLVQLRLLGSR